MTITNMFLTELKAEAETTRKFIALIPDDKMNWKPHEKSMSMQQLCNHLIELPGWIPFTLDTDELDFEKNHYEPKALHTHSEMMEFFNAEQKRCEERLAADLSSELEKSWIMRSGEHIIQQYTKAEVFRMTINQIVHHRAQLGVYFRLLNIPLPGSYGPTADEATK